MTQASGWNTSPQRMTWRWRLIEKLLIGILVGLVSLHNWWNKDEKTEPSVARPAENYFLAALYPLVAFVVLGAIIYGTFREAIPPQYRPF